MAGYDQFIGDAQELIKRNTDFTLNLTQVSIPELYGNIPIINNNEPVEIYQVKIIPTIFYPDKYPLVYEIGSKIPHNIDWHVYPDGHFCICTSTEEIFKCLGKIDLISFIDNEVKPFLYNQTHRTIFGYFLRERSHGFLGELEFLFEELKTKDLYQIVEFFKFLRHKNEPIRTAKCFCGSEKKYRYCHRSAYRKFIKLPERELYKIINYIEIIIDKIKKKNS